MIEVNIDKNPEVDIEVGDLFEGKNGIVYILCIIENNYTLVDISGQGVWKGEKWFTLTNAIKDIKLAIIKQELTHYSLDTYKIELNIKRGS